ncbi:hypothetical protein Lal_00036637 [Lupinus albus]|nr:hypothetical protein Lal_00036637 [Lupinus albus]
MNRLGIQCLEYEIDALIRVTLLTVCCLCQFRLVRGTTSIKFGAAAGDYRFIQRRNTCILHSINPEIDRTYHRLVRQNKTLDTNFVSVSEHPVAENTASEHSVAFPNFDHSVHSENMAQPPTPPGL